MTTNTSSEDNMQTFQTPNPIRLRVELWEGKAIITAADTDTTTVELTPLRGDSAAQDVIANARVEQRGDEIVVLMPKIKGGLFRSKAEVLATITVPSSSSLKFESGSADLEGNGVFGDTNVSTGSGDVSLEQTAMANVKQGSGDLSIRTANGDLDVKSGSGDVSIGSVAGEAGILSGSGDVNVDQAGGQLKVKTGSGDIVIKEAQRSIDVMAGSGDLVVRRFVQGRLKAKTGSGDVKVGVADGAAAYLDVMSVTGDVVSSLDSADAPLEGDRTVEIVVQTGTGDVVLERA